MKKNEEPKMSELELINAYCFGLIKRAKETEAQRMIVTQENVTYLEENIGNWKVTIEKV